MNSAVDKLAIIVGPTASGKTTVSVRVAQMLKAEIISGDSMQVYCGLDIGTAKIKPAEMGGVVHHLLDIRDPKENFSVADFRLAATTVIREISERGRLPLLVGGTGLYIYSLLNPYQFPPESEKDDAFRARMGQLAKERGDLFLHRRLAAVDSAAAERIHPHDHYRVVRALEVYEQTGHTISEIQAQSHSEHKPVYRTAIAGLMLRRELLYPRIERRVDEMMAAGLMDEVKGLLESGTPEHSTAMRGLGYRHMTAYLKGISTLEEAVATLKRDTRRFAKRQYTWFKRDARIRWFDAQDYFIGERYPHTDELARDIADFFEREFSSFAQSLF